MTEQQTVENLVAPPKKRSMLFLLVVVIGIVVVGLIAYLYLQENTLRSDKERLSQEIKTLEQDIAALEGENVQAAQKAQAWLDQIEENEVLWSRVLTRMSSLLPFDGTTRTQKIRFTSYSGGEGGRLTMNAQTRELAGEPFDDVAELIQIFNDSSFFYDAKTPSVTRGETNEGRKVGSFVFQVMYQDL